MIHKYRAWDKEAEYMFYSDKPEDNYFFEFDEGTLRGFAIRPPRSSGDPYEPPEPYTDDFPVMQCIGLKDKNGKEYYRGDVTDFTIFDFNGVDIQLRGEIKWLPDAFVYGVEYVYAGETNVVDLCTLAADEEREVIGNIHEKPELLESK